MRVGFVLIWIVMLLSEPAVLSAQECVPNERENQIWASIKQSSEPREFLAYLKEFPNGCYRVLANFKIKSLVDESLPLTVFGAFTQLDWNSAKENEWLESDGRPLEWLKIRPGPSDPNKLKLEYQCDAAGVGLTDWFSWDQPCAGRRAPIQGFSVRMRGNLADFYDLEVSCSTHQRPSNGGRQDYLVGNEGWCGVRGGTPSTFVFRVLIALKRKKFEE